MRDHGLMTKLLVMAFTFIQTVQDLKENERMINKMEQGKKCGLMEQVMKASIRMAKNKEKEF